MTEDNVDSPVRVEGNKVFVEDVPSKAKTEFYRVMEGRVNVLDREQYEEKVGQKSPHAHFVAVIFQIPEGKRANDSIIYVNRDDFIVGGEDFTDLIPISVRHEVSELWTYAKTGYSLSPPPKHIGHEGREAIGHGAALREEYAHAFELGKADRYLGFIKKWAQSRVSDSRDRNRIIEENEDAYQRAKSRFERRKE
jgi:hypothetical protein